MTPFARERHHCLTCHHFLLRLHNTHFLFCNSHFRLISWLVHFFDALCLPSYLHAYGKHTILLNTFVLAPLNFWNQSKCNNKQTDKPPSLICQKMSSLKEISFTLPSFSVLMNLLQRWHFIYIYAFLFFILVSHLLKLPRLCPKFKASSHQRSCGWLDFLCCNSRKLFTSCMTPG